VAVRKVRQLLVHHVGPWIDVELETNRLSAPSRPVAFGRKNHPFADSDGGGVRALFEPVGEILIKPLKPGRSRHLLGS